MITSISKKLASYLSRKNIIDKDKKEIYQYGYEVLISGLIGFAIVIILGILMNRFIESLLFLGVFVPEGSLQAVIMLIHISNAILFLQWFFLWLCL